MCDIQTFYPPTPYAKVFPFAFQNIMQTAYVYKIKNDRKTSSRQRGCGY